MKSGLLFEYGLPGEIYIVIKRFSQDLKVLTFDVFGTTMGLSASLTPTISEFLKNEDIHLSVTKFSIRWRIEQYQYNLMILGHNGCLETCRKALIYTLHSNNILFTNSTVLRHS